MSFKINFVVRLQHWMDSVPGQTFLNYAYSWGASIVILGALFKLTHLPGGNFMLFIGMGTEVVVFFLSAFDRPFDKEEIGKELPHDYETDEEIAARLGLTDDEDEENATGNDDDDDEAPHRADVSGGVCAAASQTAGMQGTGGPVYIVPSAAQQPGVAAAQPASTLSAQEAAANAIAAATPDGQQPFDAEAKRLAEIIRVANDELLHRAQAVLSPEMESATQEYITKLQTLTETFQKVDEQSIRLTRDSEEMANLNRTLTAINKTYDLHFKSISQQVGTIENINEQTRRLARQIEELNGVYGRMIQALTVNMSMQQPGVAQQPAMQQGGNAQPTYTAQGAAQTNPGYPQQ